MKTVLTLKAGSFFFLEGVHLIRDVPQEVDLSTLKVEDRKAVRLYLASGHLESSEEIPEDALKVEDVGTEGFEVAAKEEHVDDGREGHTEGRAAAEQAQEQEENEQAGGAPDTSDLVEGSPYSSQTKRELEALIKERGIVTSETTKAGLIKELDKWDQENDQVEVVGA